MLPPCSCQALELAQLVLDVSRDLLIVVVDLLIGTDSLGHCSTKTALSCVLPQQITLLWLDWSLYSSTHNLKTSA